MNRPDQRVLGLGLDHLLTNLRAGYALAVFRPLSLSRFVVSLDQAVSLLILALILAFAADTLAVVGQEAYFSLEGLLAQGTGLLLLLAGVYAVGKLARDPHTALRLLVLLASTSPVYHLLRALHETLLTRGGELPRSWHLTTLLSGALTLWCLAVGLRAIGLATGDGRRRVLILSTPLLALTLGIAAAVPRMPLWLSPEVEEETPYDRIDVEATFDQQIDLLSGLGAQLQPGRPGIVDLYFVGFSSYAYQDVFMSEAYRVKELFDSRFDTAGRSAVLVNNLKTLDRVPLASGSNLERLLRHLGSLMNPEEDVLFLLITTHGSEDHQLLVDFWPLDLNTLTPARLREILDGSGIRWRVLVISACYSGGFVDALRDEHTLVITAAASDRQSFGCEGGRDFTYFGEAFFDHALRRTQDFMLGFENARAMIDARERQEDLTPSRPQIYVGAAIASRLAELRERLWAADGGARVPVHLTKERGPRPMPLGDWPE